MKRILAALMLVILMVTVNITALCEQPYKTIDEYLSNAQYTLRVLRPKISMFSKRGGGENDKIASLYFGDELYLIRNEYDYSRVIDANGNEGYVYSGYIMYVPDGFLWLTHHDGEYGVALSPIPGLNPNDFGYAACGKRWEEKAIVLSVDGNYLYLLTEEGCSGYAFKYDGNLEVYQEHTEEEAQ